MTEVICKKTNDRIKQSGFRHVASHSETIGMAVKDARDCFNHRLPDHAAVLRLLVRNSVGGTLKQFTQLCQENPHKDYVLARVQVHFTYNGKLDTVAEIPAIYEGIGEDAIKLADPAIVFDAYLMNAQATGEDEIEELRQELDEGSKTSLFPTTLVETLIQLDFTYKVIEASS